MNLRITQIKRRSFGIWTIAISLMFLNSCKSISIHQIIQTKTTHQVPLGGVGTGKDFILQQDYNSTAVPSYVSPIKISALVKPFTKQTYKSFLKALALQSANVDIDYIDSLKVKPKFIELKIADQVTVVEALNKKENKSIKDYLSHNTSANIITTISIVFNKQDLELIRQADAVFIEEINLKTYALQLYTNSKKTKTISFNNGVVFAYKMAHCCWQENKKHQVKIVDLVSAYNSCPNNTYRSATRAKKKINYFKL